MGAAPLFTSPKHTPNFTPLHLKGTARLLKPHYKHLAPCLGAAITSNSPFVGNLMRLGDVMAPFYHEHHDFDYDPSINLRIQPASELASLLYFQMIREDPPFLSRTKSMPTAYLTPSIIGTLLALSSSSSSFRRKDETSIRDILRKEHGIKSNYINNNQWTGVSLKRWMDLLTPVVSKKDEHDDPFVIAVWLAALWEKSQSKQCFLDFWNAYDIRISGVDKSRSIFATDDYTQSILNDSIAKKEWLNDTFDPQKDLIVDNIDNSIAQLVFYTQKLKTDDHLVGNREEYSNALELVCTALVLQEFPLNSKPIVPGGYYGYDGGDAKAGTCIIHLEESDF